MPGTRYIRRDRLVRLTRAIDEGVLVELLYGDRAIRHIVHAAAVSEMIAHSDAVAISSALWSAPEIEAEFARWQQAFSPATQWPLHGGHERLSLVVEDDRLTSLPLEQALLRTLGEAHRPIPRLVRVPPRAAQVPFTLPLRLLQLDQSDDFNLPRTIKAIFGWHMIRSSLRSVVQVRRDRSQRFDRWALPSRWKTVDVLQLDQLAILPERRLFSMSTPGEVGTLGWLVRCIDVWRTRLVVIRGKGSSEMRMLRRFAHKLASQGGPAVWLLDNDRTDPKPLLAHFYNKLVHDAPIDLAVSMAIDESGPRDGDNDMLIVGCGREELVRVSAPGDRAAALARELLDPDTRADASLELRWSIARGQHDISDADAIFEKTVRGLEGIADALPSWNFDIHEGDGMIPLGKSIDRLRRNTRTAAPEPELRPTSDRSGPRFVNPALSRFDLITGHEEPIPQQGARLRLGEPVVLRIQLGPRAGYAPVLDAIALIEEPFKWVEGRKGVWLSIGLTGLDFHVTGLPIQEVWLPRDGASDVVEFVVVPTRKQISQLRFCVYYGADLLQSHRLAAIVEAGTSSDLAAALGIADARIGEAGWVARMEYAAAADLAAPPTGRDVAFSIFANDLNGRRVFTTRGTEGYEVLLAGDTSGMANDIRAKLDQVSRDRFNFYAFRQRDGVPLHNGTQEQRDAALHDLAHLGWTLFSAIFNGADRNAMAADLAGERRVIHVAHALLESVIPWAAIYDRPYNIDRQKDDSGLPVLRAVCPVGLPDATGEFPAATCGSHRDCPLSPHKRAAASAAGKGAAEDAIVCARHFWGFRHIVELPPYQEEGTIVSPTTPVAGAPATPPRRTVTSAGNPAKLLLGYNAGLGSADTHRAALQAMLAGRKLKVVRQEEASGDSFLAALRNADADLVYLFCHARGGLADPATRPPALELQESVGGPPSLIRAAALASGFRLTHHPLVVLNGCNTAVFSPDALSPFIRTLVRDCEAAGALGTEIPVFESLAGEVACQFLTKFFDAQNAGEALLAIRRDLLARGNPLGLVYTLYAVAELQIVQ